MSNWGRNDQAVTANSSTTIETSNGAPMGTWALVKGDQVNRVNNANAYFGNTSPGSRAGVDVNMFGNTTIGAFIPNVSVGVFGVNTTEVAVNGGLIARAGVLTGGSGYQANAVVTTTFANGVSNTSAITSNASGGRIVNLVIAQAGSAIKDNPTLSIAAPAAINITANTTGVTLSRFIAVTTANSFWQVNDRLLYSVPDGNTAIGGLTSNTFYFVSFANTSGICLSSTPGGANLTLTAAVTTPGEVHTIRGDTATGYAVVGGAKNKGVSHAGWVLRTEGTGGRAGRVQYETLVAMGSLGAQTAPYGTPATTADASDDTIIPDA